jgi:hypothetical protein
VKTKVNEFFEVGKYICSKNKLQPCFEQIGYEHFFSRRKFRKKIARHGYQRTTYGFSKGLLLFLVYNPKI